jgi:hypothetical protein
MVDTRPPYPGYDVLAKWRSPSFDDVTRQVLARRLRAAPQPRFFDTDQFRLLEAACARLLATPLGKPPIANFIDADQSAGVGEGYRHAEMPSAPEAWRKGLAGLDAEAKRRFGAPFVDLSAELQDAVLACVQEGQVDLASFAGLPARRFFEQVLLSAAVSQFYGRPEGWNDIGFGGPASPRGYVRLGLDRRDPWEAPLAKAMDRGQ